MSSYVDQIRKLAAQQATPTNVATGAGTTQPRSRKPRKRPGAPAAPAPRSRRPAKRPSGRYDTPLYDPSQQLSGKDLAGAANDLVGLEFGPQKAALDRELGNVTTQGTALADRGGGYYKQLADREAGNVAQEQAIGDLLKTALSGNETTASTAVQGGLDAANARATADAAIRGSLGGSQAAGAASEAQAAQDRIAGQGQISKDAGALSTQSYQQLADLAGKARQQAGGEMQQQLLNRLANAQTEVRAKQQDLAGQEGPARSKALTDLRQQAFENLITQEGLNIKSSDIQAQTALGQAKIKATATENAANRASRERIAALGRQATRDASAAKAAGKANDVNKYGYSNAEWLTMSVRARQRAISDFTRQNTKDTTRPKTGGDQMSAQAQSMVTQVENAVSDTSTDPKLARHVNEKGPRLVQIFVKRGLPPLLAQAAAELARYKSVRPSTRAALERAGIKVPSAWLSPSPNIAGGTGNPASAVGTGLG
jgi:hypothetical protein